MEVFAESLGHQPVTRSRQMRVDGETQWVVLAVGPQQVQHLDELNACGRGSAAGNPLGGVVALGRLPPVVARLAQEPAHASVQRPPQSRDQVELHVLHTPSELPRRE